MKSKRSRRISLIAFLIFFLFAILAGRLWQLQVVKGNYYAQVSVENRLRLEKIPSPRGIIRDRTGVALVRNAPFFSIALLPEMVDQADLGAIAGFLFMDLGELSDIVRRHEDPLEPIKLRDGLIFQEMASIKARLSDYPGLIIHVEQTRYYPYGEVGAHLVGYLGKLGPTELKKEDFKNVPRQAFIGQWGIEKMFDSYLRGKPGRRVIEVDALGRRLRLIKEEPPERGNDLHLSIDLELQKAAEQAFDGNVGALVALKASTGEILAMVSRPSFDPNLFSRGITYQDWVRLAEDKSYPLLNRGLQSQYPPGSTFKIATAIAGLEEGAITPDTTVTCQGAIRVGRWRFRCWKRSGHGKVDLHRAIVESCDVFFYKAGQEAGIDAIARYARGLGLEAESGLGLVKEKRGLIPDTEWKRRVKKQSWYLGETFNASIGQGFVLATPMQLARMTSTAVNGGYLYKPTPIRTEEQPEPVSRTPISQETLDIIKKALRGVVSERHGTGRAADSQIVEIGGKTGTAQVISSREETRKEEELPYKLRDHAWFVAFAPVESPEIALAVLVEHGGHGGTAAAPIARKAIEAYMNSSGAPAKGKPGEASDED
jgi:penicillin-binding protein 2